MNNLSKKSNRIFQAGIIGVAIGSALCCLLPLLAVASGVSALAAAGTLFENLRWPLIVVAGLLLVVYGYRQFFAKGFETFFDRIHFRMANLFYFWRDLLLRRTTNLLEWQF